MLPTYEGDRQYEAYDRAKYAEDRPTKQRGNGEPESREYGEAEQERSGSAGTAGLLELFRDERRDASPSQEAVERGQVTDVRVANDAANARGRVALTFAQPAKRSVSGRKSRAIDVQVGANQDTHGTQEDGRQNE